MTDIACPVPLLRHERVLLGHGGGGRLTGQLLEDIIRPAFGHASIAAGLDGATLPLGGGTLVVSTDSFVVQPLEFPGGDIGSLAVTGTVNDLAVSGARPRYLTLGLILEEGLPLELLQRVVASIRTTAEATGVTIVTGDTKVVGRGQADGIYVNTTGVGEPARPGLRLAPDRVRPGDRVLVSGDLGRHGVAIMAAREELQLELSVASDCAPVHETVLRMLDGGLTPRCLRDPTRGGLGAVLHEIAGAADLSVVLDETALPVHPAVAAACELLGLDPLHVACEGRLVAVVPPEEAEASLAALREGPGGERAAIVGEVTAAAAAPLILRTSLGTRRIVDLPSGSQLPRIC